MNRVSSESVLPSTASLDHSIEAATAALLALQQGDGHWVFELEADATIPAEYVLLRHYLGEPVDVGIEAKIASYLRRIQGDHGGWPLFRDGALDERTGCNGLGKHPVPEAVAVGDQDGGRDDGERR